LELIKHLPDQFEVSIHDVFDQNNNGFHDELNETTWKLTTLTISGISCKLLLSWVEVVFTPELLHKFKDIKFELVGIDTSKAG